MTPQSLLGFLQNTVKDLVIVGVDIGMVGINTLCPQNLHS